ncbi:MAG: FG-GAP repeat protein [Phycisphaerales bacterium]
MTRNVFRFNKRLIGPVVTTALVVLVAAGPAWGQPSEVLKLLASDAAAEDEFGFSVSIGGDTAVVGAPFNDDDGDNSGLAYIFQRDYGGTDNWGEVHKLLAEDADEGDLFGFSVAISGDFAIVGARRNDDNGSNSGSAYIFYRNQGGTDLWGQVTKITASNAATSDSFGRSVDISGDLAVIGAPLVGSNVGAAYIFERDGAGVWNEVAILTASDGAAADFFGLSVSISGDTALVGADGDDDNGSLSGSAYVFVKPPGGWVNMTETAKLTPFGGAAFDFFGFSVAISIDTAVVGAIGDDSFIGSAYIFERDAGGPDKWGQTAKLTAFDGANSDEFGTSVSIRGEGVIVGAKDDGFAVGSAYLFREPPTGWQNATENDKITASDAAAGDEFGFFVSISGDLAIVGAHLNDDNGTSSGSAYIFDGVCPCPWDVNGDYVVDAADLLSLLVNWGSCADCNDCPADFDDNCTVGSSDLLSLLVNWGLCPCVEGTPPLSLADELANVCLTMDHWDDFVDKMQTGTQAEKDNYLCWMIHYLDHCSRCNCVDIHTCPDDDPFDD